MLTSFTSAEFLFFKDISCFCWLLFEPMRLQLFSDHIKMYYIHWSKYSVFTYIMTSSDHESSRFEFFFCCFCLLVCVLVCFCCLTMAFELYQKKKTSATHSCINSVEPTLRKLEWHLNYFYFIKNNIHKFLDLFLERKLKMDNKYLLHK
jgi:hypothetical protein